MNRISYLKAKETLMDRAIAKIEKRTLETLQRRAQEKKDKDVAETAQAILEVYDNQEARNRPKTAPVCKQPNLATPERQKMTKPTEAAPSKKSKERAQMNDTVNGQDTNSPGEEVSEGPPESAGKVHNTAIESPSQLRTNGKEEKRFAAGLRKRQQLFRTRKAFGLEAVPRRDTSATVWEVGSGAWS
ncbi:hypothetical protein BSKO_08207 [Bryopsis sp. KO-2023]|nr:hypothetical protein BSKO_08207 [Bryopsis sp. KO-2023]